MEKTLSAQIINAKKYIADLEKKRKQFISKQEVYSKIKSNA